MKRNKFPIKERWLDKIWEKWCDNVYNVLYVKKEKIYPAYLFYFKNTSNCEKEVIILMIPNGEGRKRLKTLATSANT